MDFHLESAMQNREQQSDISLMDLLENQDCVKIKLIIRRPQEGKTFIMISDIMSDQRNSLNIIFTMNTINSNQQLYSRLLQKCGPNKLLVFNSRPESVGPGCLHAKGAFEALQIIMTHSISCLVVCAHSSKIRKQIPSLLRLLGGLRNFTRDVKIHIDEAHKYIPENRESVIDMHNMPIVKEITGYSASPKNIWVPYHSIFGNMYIVDVAAEMGIMTATDYFGVRDTVYVPCELSSRDLIEWADLNPAIPSKILNMVKTNSINWLVSSVFGLGNEVELLSFVKFTLAAKLVNDIDPDQFSYHFIPAYTRRATHYMIAEMILEQFPTANVIVMNGQHFGLYRTNEIVDFPKDLINVCEPSKKVEYLIRGSPDRPTFITGFTCLGMSITLINELLGNFDNVLMCHQHYSDDISYQLCRFLFNYTSWSDETRRKIKSTRFHCLHAETRDRCLAYEVLTLNIMENLSGEMRTKEEITGQVDPNAERNHRKRLNRKERQEIIEELGRSASVVWHRIPVFDGNDEERWSHIRQTYRIHHEKEIGRRVMPKKNGDGFYISSLTKQKTILSNTDIKRHKQTDKWNSLHDLCMQTNYSRLFVGYDDAQDSGDYTIWMKQTTLEPTERVMVLLGRYRVLKREFTALNNDDGRQMASSDNEDGGDSDDGEPSDTESTVSDTESTVSSIASASVEV